jgi:hypothetical protein
MRELSRELADDGEEAAPFASTMAQPRRMFQGLLDPADEELVRALGDELEAVAWAIVPATRPEGMLPLDSAVVGLVGGAEMVMRTRLAAGEGESIELLLPDFVYLTTLLFCDRVRARALALRIRELLRVAAG